MNVSKEKGIGLADSEMTSVSFHAFDPQTGKHQKKTTPKKSQEKFIKGPIPLKWIARANSLPGKAGNIGVALWFLVGVKGSYTVKLTGEIAKIAACDRKAIYYALTKLEEASLISVMRSPGARATITVLPDLVHP